MRLRFTKMHGAGNDFVVLDATHASLDLTPSQWQRLADRRLGVGADQILIVGPADRPGVDFTYRIINADGGEVEQCGNGARCFVRYVHDKGLTTRTRIRVSTRAGIIEPQLQPDGSVTVDMGTPRFEPVQVPFNPAGLAAREVNGLPLWPLDLPGGHSVEVAVASMGNPHAVQRVDDVDQAPVAEVGPLVEQHGRFPQRVNAGFMQVLAPDRVRLRVYERGAGETLACGTGACAAAVLGMRLGWLGPQVRVDTRGGRLDIAWAGGTAPVLLSGPAQTVFEGEIEL